MKILPQLPGPHDIPFAAPLWGGIILGAIIGYVIFHLLDVFIAYQEKWKRR